MTGTCRRFAGVGDWPQVTTRDDPRFGYRDGERQFKEADGGTLDRTCLASDIIAAELSDDWATRWPGLS